MNMTRKASLTTATLALGLLLFLGLGGVAPAQEVILQGDFAPADQAQRFVKALATGLNPEEMTVTIDQSPTNGEIRHLYVEARGARALGVRVDRIAMEAFFVKLTDQPDRPFSALEGLFHCSILEEDVNRFLKDATAGSGGDSWTKLSVRFADGGLKASGTFTPKGKGVSAVVRVEGRLSIRDQRAVELKDYTVKVNGSETDMEAIRRSIDGAQPIIDLSDMPFPVKLRSISTSAGRLTLDTQRSPSPFQGISYRFRP